MKTFRSVLNVIVGLRFLVLVPAIGLVAVSLTATALMQGKQDNTKNTGSPSPTPQEITADFWQELPKSQAFSSELRTEVDAKDFRAFTLDSEAIKTRLENAPMEFSSAAREGTFILSLPAPGKGFQRFAVQESPIMESGLAALHPDIKTFSGTGIDDLGATIRFDQTPLGFHASVRGTSGNWYIDPKFHLDQSVYVSYLGRDLTNRHGPLIENELVNSIADKSGISSNDLPPSELAVGDNLRTYRLALLTDPSYATYFGGSANVTAAKVTLINRVTQIYEYDLSMRLRLIASNDQLNLDTAAQMTGANGPCGGAACFSAAQASSCTSATLTRNRVVIGLLVGASSFDIGHVALGLNGGGVASLGVVGGTGKAQGCTGVPTPVGDFFAVDYVAHEMGHQFAGNHTFNGTISNCSTTNRNAGTSVEPGSGSSVMAYAGICGTDNSQPHSDPYFSQRSFDEMTTYTSAAETNLSEVQMGVLTGFAANGQQFQIRYNGNDSAPIVRGTNFTTAGVKAAIEGITGWPAGYTVTISTLGDTAFTITHGGTAAGLDVGSLTLVSPSGGATGYINEITKGGVTTRGGAVSATGNAFPVVTTPATFTIPIRTPFALTGSATDADSSDTLTYLWEQNDRGATGTTAGTGLVTQPKLNGPLFRVFGVLANVTPAGTILYNSPGENIVTTNPTRVFPDMLQILANNTNAATGTCPLVTPSTPTAAEIDCFSEFLPTAAYTGTTGVNASPLSLNFRMTVRDGRGGVNSSNTQLQLAPTAGPFLVTSQSTNVTYNAASSQVIAWDVAGTSAPPINVSNVKISLSTDGGLTYPNILAANTPNDGSEAVTIPNVGTTAARIKIEAVGNVFFDVNDTTFTIAAPSAAGVSVAGRILTTDGVGLRNAIVTLTDSQGIGRQISTSSFGYFRFDDVTVGATYIVTVTSKRYQFAPQVVSISDDIYELDITAQ